MAGANREPRGSEKAPAGSQSGKAGWLIAVALLAVGAGLFGSGCGSTANPVDAGVADAGRVDGGCQEGEPVPGLTCLAAGPDGGWGTCYDSACCGGVPTCPEAGTLVRSDGAACTYLNFVVGCP